jgi:hypothetical protein
MQQTSNPPGWLLACIGPSLVLLLVTGLQSLPGHPPPEMLTLARYVLGGVQLLMLPFLGGFHYRAGPEGLQVRLGFLRLPLKSLPWAEVRELEVVSGIEPLNQFRGLGWRVHRRARTTGYVATGGEGLTVRTADWTYVLAMPRPQAFAEAANRWRARG